MSAPGRVGRELGLRSLAWPAALLGLLALLWTVPGCTREPASKAFAGKGVQLSFMFWGDPAEVQTVRHYINEFQKANPGIAVQLIHQPSSVYRDNLRIRAPRFRQGSR